MAKGAKRDKALRREKPAEPPSPGTALGADDRDLPGEGELPRREDMGPGDHRPRQEGER